MIFFFAKSLENTKNRLELVENKREKSRERSLSNLGNYRPKNSKKRLTELDQWINSFRLFSSNMKIRYRF